MRTIESQFKSFEKLVVPQDAGSAQRKDMKMAFFAGVQSVLNLQLAVADSNVSEDVAVEVLESWHSECRKFAETIFIYKEGN